MFRETPSNGQGKIVITGEPRRNGGEYAVQVKGTQKIEKCGLTPVSSGLIELILWLPLTFIENRELRPLRNFGLTLTVPLLLLVSTAASPVAEI